MATVSAERPSAPKIISRAEARRIGLSRYHDGKACARGHVNPERYVSSGNCLACLVVIRRTPEHRAARVEANRKYMQTPGGKRSRCAADARYRTKLRQTRPQL
jgi:hypothetical protein